jgi:hypothetical protein
MKRGKWFRPRKNCFFASRATKQSREKASKFKKIKFSRLLRSQKRPKGTNALKADGSLSPLYL